MTEASGSEDDRQMLVGAQLLYVLDDPFSAFPIQTVARVLAGLVSDSESNRASRSMWGQIPPSWYAVHDEHDVDVESCLVGAAFVLSQGVIVEAVSIMKKLAEINAATKWLPRKKTEILAFQAAVNSVTGISLIALIDAVANYVKHRHEWPSDWHGSSPQQRSTISPLTTIGLRPGDHAANLHRALGELGARSDELLPMMNLVIDWRRHMAERVRSEWGIPSPHE